LTGERLGNVLVGGSWTDIKVSEKPSVTRFAEEEHENDETDVPIDEVKKLKDRVVQTWLIQPSDKE